MTEKTPYSSPRSDRQARRAPGWIAPALAGAVAVAVTWGIGSTLFHGALVEHGLPEQVSEASADQRTMWEQGAKLADLASQAQALAKLAPEENASQLSALATSLSQGSALLGELRFDDQEPAALPQRYSPDALVALATNVAHASAQMPAFEEPSLPRDSKLAEIAFQINLDARRAVASSGDERDHDLALPLSKVAGEEKQNDQLVACLPHADLLDPAMEITGAQDIEPTAVARALDRGYALDFLLQLTAARGAESAEDAIEDRRSELGNQLRGLRDVVDDRCADLREPAYALPEGGLEELAKLSAAAEEDFAEALVVAAGNTDGAAGLEISALAFQALRELHGSSSDYRLLETVESKK